MTLALRQNDQVLATQEKTGIENEQRRRIKEYQTTGIEWQPYLFRMDSRTKQWIYIHAE